MSGGFSYTVRPILPTDSVGSFQCGDPKFQPLKTFLKKDAKEFHDANIARTWVAIETHQVGDDVCEVNPASVLAYITLTCSEVCIRDAYIVEDPQRANFYKHLPAVKIARLAVDARHRDKKIGGALVDLAIAIAQDQVGSMVGCRFVTTDAKQDAIPFYKHRGFVLLDTETNLADEAPVMFLDLQRL